MTTPFDYMESRDDADDLIAEFGRAVLIRRQTASGTPFDPTVTNTDYATVAARIEFTFRQQQTGSVLATDERWMIAAGPLAALGVTTILPSDHIVVDGVEHSVGPLSRPLAPAGTVVLFDVQAQK
ncbi:hypothetical protein ACQR1I_36330 [Bradyrhizobium sp. HKCCYLS2038]|uniref:hypothetical protein n=1 Tax=Bradyrhizobium sp. HKCCYLS2038 TaxID=3420764 RepID=UPI003EC05C73